MSLSAAEALERLRAGNARFVADTPELTVADAHERRFELVNGQSPHTVVLGCSDSRAPTEVIFDQGLGELFVIRVAGNVVGPDQAGSVEYGVEVLGSRLVVVLGHSGCGAVRATLDSMFKPGPELSPAIESIVSKIRPAVADLGEVAGEVEADVGDGPFAAEERMIEELLASVVQANVRRAVRDLTEASEPLARAVAEGRLRIVGAEYDLATGAVDFLDR